MIRHGHLAILMFLVLTSSNVTHANTPLQSFVPPDSSATPIDPRAFCPSGLGGEACVSNVELWAEQHSSALSAALSTTTDREALLDDESAWVATTERECANDAECFRQSLMERNAHLNAIQQEATTSEIQPSPEASSETPSEDAESDDQSVAESLPSSPMEQEALGQEQAVQATTETKETITTGDQPIANGKTGPTPLTEAEKWSRKLLLLAFFGIVLTFIVILALAAFGKIVFYYDASDFGWSLSPVAIAVLTAILVVIFRAGEDRTSDLDVIQIAIIAVGCIAASIGVIAAFRNAIHYNRSLFIGLLVGACKNLVAGFMIFSLFGNMGRKHRDGYYKNNEHGRRERATAATSFAILAFLWFALVNGERVYENKGWQLS